MLSCGQHPEEGKVLQPLCCDIPLTSPLPQPFLLPLSPWPPAGQGQAAGKAGKEGWSKHKHPAWYYCVGCCLQRCSAPW